MIKLPSMELTPKIIHVEDNDVCDMLFYHSPDNKFFYIVVLGVKTTAKTFAAAFPKAKNVSKRKFDFKLRKVQLLQKFRKGIEFKVVTVADDTFIDNFVNT